jgi:hypothetical protein
MNLTKKKKKTQAQSLSQLLTTVTTLNYAIFNAKYKKDGKNINDFTSFDRLER